MNHTRTCAVCAAIVSLHTSFAGAAQLLKAIPSKVDLGTFNAFQIKETIVKLKNTGRETFHIDKIKANCACIKTMIATKDIPPGKTVELKVAARERTGGKFSHDLLIIPRDTESYAPLKIQTVGKVIQPVFAKVGWEGKKLATFDPNRPLNLGLVHKLLAKPVIQIYANVKHFNLRKAVPDVNNALFELHHHKLERPSVSDQAQKVEQRRESLTLCLRPKKKLKIGMLTEILRIKLADEVGLEIPISCRIVGDVYATERSIHFGNLSDNTPKRFTIRFANNAGVWPELRWDIKGYLSSTIAIRREEIVRTDSQIRVILAVDQSRLASLPQGYVFCRVKFFQAGATDEAVSLMVDGFNTKP